MQKSGVKRTQPVEAAASSRGDYKKVVAPSPIAAGAPDSHADEVERFRRSIRRCQEANASLPLATQATCPTCRAVVPAKFVQMPTLTRAKKDALPVAPETVAPQIVLETSCPACGLRREVHADAIWSTAASEWPGSARETFAGKPIQPVLRRLPRTVETLCPECCAVIVGRYFVADGAVWIEKTCPQHGHFRDCISSDALLYSKASWWTFEEHPGQKHPKRSGSRCPSDCGVCGQHQSSSCLAQIDLTNRCNMRCPVCFANAGVAGYVYEPSFDQIVAQLQALREMDPSPATAIQFTGGEPTLHPDFLKILSTARQMGFSHIQMATNGIHMAEESFARAAAEAGLHTLYLQFDGVGEEAYSYTRNYRGIWQKKLDCIANCRKLDLKVCLVPTIIRGVNDEQVANIFRFAIENIDTVSAISYQPVSFSGRIEPTELAAKRYTLGHLAHAIADVSGAVPLRDMYPLSIVLPLAQFLQAVTGKPKIRPSCHPDCAFGTYFMVSPEGKAYAFPQVVDVEGMFCEMNILAKRLEPKGGKLSFLDKMAIFRMFKRHFKPESAPPGLDVKRFIRSLQGLVDKNLGRGESEKSTYKTLLCAGMHFQDRYNYDVQRVKRCVILYSTSQGIVPFCAYNCGPEYRRLVESCHVTGGQAVPAVAAASEKEEP